MSGERRATAARLAALAGIWRSRGYGFLLVIDEDGYRLLEQTRVSLQAIAAGSLTELAERFVALSLSPAGRALALRPATGVTRIRFRRLARMPAVGETGAAEASDPEFNFEVAWHHLAEHYALFGLKGVDWQRAYQTHRPRVGPDTPAEDLFAVLADMLRPLRDGHVRLHAPHAHFDAGAAPGLHARLGRELDAAADARGVEAYLHELREAEQALIARRYLRRPPRSRCNGLLAHGRLAGGAVGYLAIRAMAGQSGRLGAPLADCEAVDAAMAEIMAELGELPALVVDVRGNGGGYDAVALRLAGYLTDRRRPTFTKSVRHGDGFTGGETVHVAPLGARRYRGRIYLLTSELTASAAEIFVLALLQHPRCTRVGEATEGILSDFLERHLPNGWLVTLSNELYRAADGALYEDVGIPPHRLLPYLDRHEREAGRDGMLEAVLADPALQ